ncbi:MAG TPA: hypothetical protein VKT70_09320 [Stellaceae bacterium]|nr:hypothetical protein [Stellaceae bacterium]
MTLLQAFVAGFIAVPIFHQILLWILNVTHVVPFPAFDMSPTWPLGVPAWISASFWGGVWGIIFVLTIPRLFRGASYWIAAVVASALALTLVFAFVVIPLKTGGFLGIKDFIGLMIIGSLLNGAWGIGTALFLKLFDQLLGTRPAMS